MKMGHQRKQIKTARLFPAIPVVFLAFLVLILLAAAARAEAVRRPLQLPTAQSSHLTVQFFNRKIIKGAFIVADPRIVDPNFSRTVVLLIHHDVDGSMGLIINRPTATPLSRLLPDMKEFIHPSDHLFRGGPVLPGNLMLLFQTERPPKRMAPVFEDVYFSEEARVLADLLMSTVMERGFRIYSGHAGWAPGQLQAEMGRGDWRLVRADAEMVFGADPDMVWEKMYNRSQARSVQHDVPPFSSQPPPWQVR
ncbi:MAG: YqgE/AlgH family protein, partial [Nitrospiria bacterium]